MSNIFNEYTLIYIDGLNFQYLKFVISKNELHTLII